MAERETVQVDREEQINGLVRKLRQSGARQVTFVVPEGAEALRNPVNVRLLRFYAEQERKRVRLITGDAVVQRLADEAGIDWTQPDPQETRLEPVVSAPTDQAEKPRSARQAKALAGGRPRWAHLLAVPGLILLIGGWQLLSGPAVTVTVRPALEDRTWEVTVRGRVGARSGGGEIPLTVLQAPVTSSATVSTTGKRTYGVSRSRGSVTFLNQEPQPVKVPAGTTVATAAGTSFRVLEAVQVPGVTTEYFMKIAVGLRAGQAEARVEAVEPGSGGNVSEGRIVKIRGQLSGRLQVTNPEPVRGGEDRSVPVVTAADVGRAEREAVADLARRARPVLEALVPKGAQLIPASVRLSPPGVSGEGRAGDEGKEFTATAGTTAFGLAYRTDALRGEAVEAFRRKIPPGYALLPDSVTVTAPQFGRVEPQMAELLVTVSGRVAREIDPAVVRKAVRGKTPDQAEAAVRALPGVGEVRIVGARRRLPSWTGRLRVTIAAPAAGAL